ncbi:hypothetical protein H0H87_002269 [Tephrocybe sp. NHM501043]|nr:hypothetical protein H0H87_002269 [Tephrocybe sp. NHM501043]
MHNSQYFPPYPRRRLDSNHPAVHITPFGLPDGETPRFKHTPGSDMRIATRRLDGGWQFSDPQPPFTPSGASNRVVPSPSSSKGKLPPDMRIATRGSDGAWQFSDPEAPFTPSGVSDIDVTPSPSSSTGLLPPRVSSRDGSSKGSYRHESNITLPPPAYGYDYSGHLSPRKR